MFTLTVSKRVIFYPKVPPPSNLNPKPYGEDKDNQYLMQKEIHKFYTNDSGTYELTYINRTRKINISGMLIEYEGEDSGIGLLFASKAMIQIFINPISGTVIDRIGKQKPYIPVRLCILGIITFCYD